MPIGRSTRRQRGSALLLAMVIMTLIVTLAAGMVWQNARAIQVEGAQRARAQSIWMLHGALDWAGLILTEDAQKGNVDHLGEPWATPLAEARLTTFLAADRTGVADEAAADNAPDAFLSGSITDAQARWNLRNLIMTEGKIDDQRMEVLRRLCDAVHAPGGTADQLAQAYLNAWQGGERAPVMPAAVRDLEWLGIDRAVVDKLATVIVLLPRTTKLNLNTASAEVISAVLGGSAGLGQALVEARKRSPFQNKASLVGLLADPQMKVWDTDLDVKTEYFEVRGRMRLEDRIVEELSIVQRGQDRRVTPIHRERVNLVEPARQR